MRAWEKIYFFLSVRWMLSRGRRPMMWGRIYFHLEPVKQLIGQLTAFKGLFLFKDSLSQFLKFGLKQFQPKQRKADTCSQLQAFCIGAIRFYCTYKVPRESIPTNIGGNKQERKGSSSTRSKAERKTSSQTNSMAIFHIHSHSFWTWKSFHSVFSVQI